MGVTYSRSCVCVCFVAAVLDFLEHVCFSAEWIFPSRRSWPSETEAPRLLPAFCPGAERTVTAETFPRSPRRPAGPARPGSAAAPRGAPASAPREAALSRTLCLPDIGGLPSPRGCAVNGEGPARWNAGVGGGKPRRGVREMRALCREWWWLRPDIDWGRRLSFDKASAGALRIAKLLSILSGV